MKIEYDGRTYEFEELDLDINEAETIQKYVGRSLGDWSNGLTTCEIKSVMALWWLLRKQAGENPGAIAAKVPGFKPLKLWKAWADATRAELEQKLAEQEAAEAGTEPDPTKPPSALLSLAVSAGTTTTAAPPAASQSLPG